MLDRKPIDTKSPNKIKPVGTYSFVNCLLDNAWLNRTPEIILCLSCFCGLSESAQNYFQHISIHHLNIGTTLPVAKCRVYQQEVPASFPVCNCDSCFSHLVN